METFRPCRCPHREQAKFPWSRCQTVPGLSDGLRQNTVGFFESSTSCLIVLVAGKLDVLFLSTAKMLKVAYTAFERFCSFWPVAKHDVILERNLRHSFSDVHNLDDWV